jgi:hypothetical protein
VGEERVPVDVVGTSFVLTRGASERVDGRSDPNVGEADVFEHLSPARTGQPAGYSTGPQVDITQRLGWYRTTVGDVSEL